MCTILRGIETLVVAMNSCEVKCAYMTLYGQAARPEYMYGVQYSCILINAEANRLNVVIDM